MENNSQHNTFFNSQKLAFKAGITLNEIDIEKDSDIKVRVLEYENITEKTLKA